MATLLGFCASIHRTGNRGGLTSFEVLVFFAVASVALPVPRAMLTPTPSPAALLPLPGVFYLAVISMYGSKPSHGQLRICIPITTSAMQRWSHRLRERLCSVAG